MMQELSPLGGFPFLLAALLAAAWVVLLGQDSSWR
jgi:hypothetical protein